MRKSYSKETRMAIQTYLEEVADMPINDIKIKFIDEMLHRLATHNHIDVAIEWLQGLGIPIAFCNYEIARLMAVWLDDSVESQEAYIKKCGDSMYWRLLAREVVR